MWDSLLWSPFVMVRFNYLFNVSTVDINFSNLPIRMSFRNLVGEIFLSTFIHSDETCRDSAHKGFHFKMG